MICRLSLNEIYGTHTSLLLFINVCVNHVEFQQTDLTSQLLGLVPHLSAIFSETCRIPAVEATIDTAGMTNF